MRKYPPPRVRIPWIRIRVCPRIQNWSSVHIRGTRIRVPGGFGIPVWNTICDRTHEKRLEYAQVEVHYIAYFGTQGNLSMTPPRMSSSYNTLPNINLQSLESENSSSGLRKRWNWESLRKSSDLPQASQSSSSASPTKRKHSEDDDDEREIKHQISDDSTTSQQSTCAKRATASHGKSEFLR